MNVRVIHEPLCTVYEADNRRITVAKRSGSTVIEDDGEIVTGTRANRVTLALWAEGNQFQHEGAIV